MGRRWEAERKEAEDGVSREENGREGGRIWLSASEVI